ncbi:type II secretion system protein F (GspF) [Methylobacillus rhizosphaerae]|uniref:Type II secretion system protein F (GspF) n=1 Tax=Methylobacillus rhizosphaerae TaxID=551994 RepID=A0A238YJT3_9PROT|nr:type II secretion system F family protein [Methylobacillus rhizosphaerae]SNR71516.1 type II secretion system protein F (GspF) [Methylobacillus rhizosphaerae]
MNTWIIFSIVVLLFGAVVLMYVEVDHFKRNEINARFDTVLGRPAKRLTFDSSKQGVLQQLASLPFTKDEEIVLLFSQAGLYGTKRVIFNAVLQAGPVFLAALAFAATLLLEQSMLYAAMVAFIAFAVMYVGTRRVLRMMAASRVAKIRKEITTFLHLLVMLFDSGLSLEQALRTMVEQTKSILPALSLDLQRALNRISVGEDRGEALTEMTRALGVRELTDAIAMLRQVSNDGGNVRKSIMEYATLLEERQLAELREYVSKLSGKMSIVMMLLLFPALMLFIAGPGFISLMNMFSTL